MELPWQLRSSVQVWWLSSTIPRKIEQHQLLEKAVGEKIYVFFWMYHELEAARLY